MKRKGSGDASSFSREFIGRAARIALIVVLSLASLSAPVLPPRRQPALLAVPQPSIFAPHRAGDLIVAPDGRPDNPGTTAHPLDLATALSVRSPAGPGDTIWLRGGTYRGAFESHLTGSDGHPIIVRQFSGERATIDGHSGRKHVPALTVGGAHTWYWGFEVTDSNPVRADRGTGLQVYGPHTRFIDLVVHDTANGFGVWSPAIEAEVYGNLIYDNGWDGPDRGHGHSIYVQNQVGSKRIVDNVLFDSYGFGIHVYTRGGFIDNVTMEGNIAFNHGTPSRVSGPSANILIGGWRIARNLMLISNYTYYPVESAGTNADIGHGVGCRGATVRDNYFIGGVPLVLTACSKVTVSGNTFLGQNLGALKRWPNNTFLTTSPSQPTVIVRPNKYEAGRAHVVIYNWNRSPEVGVSLAATGLRVGDSFQIRDVRRYFEGPVLQAVYSGGTVHLPMSAAGEGNTGMSSDRVLDFAAFVVVNNSSRQP